jgi:hypothetical protein
MKNIKGSATLEAAITLPVFISIIASLIFVIRIVQVHEILHRAITESANELSMISYTFQVTGVKDLDDSIEDSLADGSSEIKEQVDLLNDPFDQQFSFPDTIKNIYDVISEIADDPEEEIRSILCLASETIFKDLKMKALSPILKLLIKNNLADTSGVNSEFKLVDSVIENGLDGISFQGSSFINNENDITIMIRYKIRFPFPVRIFPSLNISQSICVRAWADSEDLRRQTGESGNDNIWYLDNFTRGKKLRDIFGGNLPYGFPVISKFKDGVATMIKSMDTTLEYYQDADNIREKVDEYMNILSKYKGQDGPWGKDRITLPIDSINTFELLLIIPENPLEPNIEEVLNECRIKAYIKGVRMVIIKYLLK